MSVQSIYIKGQLDSNPKSMLSWRFEKGWYEYQEPRYSDIMSTPGIAYKFRVVFRLVPVFITYKNGKKKQKTHHIRTIFYPNGARQLVWYGMGWDLCPEERFN